MFSLCEWLLFLLYPVSFRGDSVPKARPYRSSGWNERERKRAFVEPWEDSTRTRRNAEGVGLQHRIVRTTPSGFQRSFGFNSQGCAPLEDSRGSTLGCRRVVPSGLEQDRDEPIPINST